MSGRVFLLHDDESLTAMTEEPYEAEALLQQLLAQYPELLAGDQLNPSDPRRWLLISREVAVPGEAAGGARWSLDHLFIDQDGIPTLVEVKRSSNNQIRREVVGQMLDYAANGSAYWSLEQIISTFETWCDRSDIDPDDALAHLLEGRDDEAFWQSVKTNLQAGRVRMLFVADEIPSELRRIIEFLNEQMDPAEVLGVEVKKFTGEQGSVLVPRVVGMTAEAETKKAFGPAPTWDEESFVDHMVSQRSPEETATATRILEWAKDRGLSVKWGRGRKTGSFSPKLEANGGTHNMFTVYSDGSLPIQFESMRIAPFNSIERKRGLASRLEAIAEGIAFTDNDLDRWPHLKLHMLSSESPRNGFFAAWDWYIGQIVDAAGPTNE